MYIKHSEYRTEQEHDQTTRYTYLCTRPLLLSSVPSFSYARGGQTGSLQLNVIDFGIALCISQKNGTYLTFII